MKANLNSDTIAIIAISKDDIIYQFNKGAETLLGYSASEMIGFKKKNSFFAAEEYEIFKNDVKAQYHEENSGLSACKILSKYSGYDSREWTVIRKDGSTFVGRSTLTPLRNENGEDFGALRIIQDITDQKKLESELLRKNQVLNDAEKITMMGHWQWNIVTNKVTWSSNLFNIFEVDSNENLNFETYFSFVHPDDKEIVDASFKNSIKDKNFYELLHRIISTGGKTKSIQLLGEVITDSEGQVIEIIGTCQDVTQQRMAEIKFKGLLESAPDAMIIANDAGKIHLVNKQAEILFGYASQELIGKPVELLIPKKYNNHQSHRSTYFEQPKITKLGDGRELFCINKAGMEIPIQISISPLKTEEGILVSATIRDITVQKRAERKIIEANENLELLAKKLTSQNAQLAEFAQITSHNLRAPVSNLNSLLDLYKCAESQEDKSMIVEKFETVTHHLTDTLNTLIEALQTKNESSKKLEVLSYQEILQKTKEILTAQIFNTKATITCDFVNNPNIKFNRVYLESIFLNLVSNAIKYKSNDRNPEIFIESIVENGVHKLIFKDNGLGINLDRHGHKVFGLNKVFHRHPDAKGVGLFMTKVQIESMGGKISVDSQVNVGSTFSINFNV
ncbi:PAS domain S-box protein [Flavobacterium algicola]|uniref:PAS domain S-box protein n=1 Tax=Flavobacterium algicola TaxID=556529 RepID=UPI001EFCFC4D|nr:PAS domain S-box protein [Flavobacterium algicola]MCG9790927.1 PAS domain S-box protein [Flavobacterium algicola]